MKPEDFHRMWTLSRQHGLTMWGMLDGNWKWVVAVDGDQLTISDWQRSTEIGNRRTVSAEQFSEFDLTVSH